MLCRRRRAFAAGSCCCWPRGEDGARPHECNARAAKRRHAPATFVVSRLGRRFVAAFSCQAARCGRSQAVPGFHLKPDRRQPDRSAACSLASPNRRPATAPASSTREAAADMAPKGEAAWPGRGGLREAAWRGQQRVAAHQRARKRLRASAAQRIRPGGSHAGGVGLAAAEQHRCPLPPHAVAGGAVRRREGSARAGPERWGSVAARRRSRPRASPLPPPLLLTRRSRPARPAGKDAKATAAKAAKAVKKNTWKKSLKPRYSVVFHRPKTLKRTRDPKYTRKRCVWRCRRCCCWRCAAWNACCCDEPARVA